MSNKNKTREQLQLLRDEALEEYLNRENFQYDVNADAVYQQYKNRYQELGRNAMQDTMGQASALTGGYGSSYAQNVGQQAYQGYLQQLGDVIPELYQLAYNRYQDRGDQLYKAYQSWSQQEQEAAQREQNAAQQEQEAARLEWEKLLADREEMARQEEMAMETAKLEASQKEAADKLAWEKQEAANKLAWEKQEAADKLAWEKQAAADKLAWEKQEAADQLAWEKQKAATKQDDQTAQEENQLPQSDYYAWLSTYQSKGQRADSNTPTVVTKYDNQNVSTGNIMVMQRMLGQKETGMWTLEDRKAAGGLSADAAFAAYQKGKLQKYQNVNLGDAAISADNIKSLERMLGTAQNGIWDDEDRKAAGGLSAFSAWQASRKGKLQIRG